MAIEQPAQTIGLDPDQGPLSFKAPQIAYSITSSARPRLAGINLALIAVSSSCEFVLAERPASSAYDTRLASSCDSPLKGLAISRLRATLIDPDQFRQFLART